MGDRLKFLKWARDAGVEDESLRRYRIYDYEPGHVRYQFGHYPTRKPYYPTEKDWRLLDLYAEKGLGVIHVWNWSDMEGFFGKSPYEPLNEKGLRRFIDECHRRRLKVIPYVSPGYLDVRNPIYRPEWSRGIGHLVELYYDLDMLCPGSPGWRAYFFSAVDRLMDDYGFDGVYWDGGMGLGRPGCANPNPDNHVHFADVSLEKQGDVDHLDDAVEGKIDEALSAIWNEFICEIYARVKKRNGVVVAHIGSDVMPPFKDKSWDYLLLGEGVPDILTSVEKTKLYEPFVIRFQDWSRLITNWEQKDFTPKLELVPKIERLSMAGSVPYLQFDWLEGGNYGEDEDIFEIPGVTWKKEYDIWTEWIKAQKKAGLPAVMGASFIGGQDRYFKYIQTYKEMTVKNTLAYIEVRGMKSDSFPLTAGTRRVSVFVNDSLWVAIGNLETSSQSVLVKPLENKDNSKAATVTLNPESLTVLHYYDLTSGPEIIDFRESE